MKTPCHDLYTLTQCIEWHRHDFDKLFIFISSNLHPKHKFWVFDKSNKSLCYVLKKNVEL